MFIPVVLAMLTRIKRRMSIPKRFYYAYKTLYTVHCLLLKRNPFVQNLSFSKLEQVQSDTGENLGRTRSDAYQYTNQMSP